MRARDIVTIFVCNDLLKVAKTPQEILKINFKKLEKIIFRIGFYKNKAKTLHKACKYILENYNGKVPNKLEELLKIPGVGRKTANLVLSMAFNKPAICVDIHVHRISNRLGFIKTKNVLESELTLQKILSKKYWSCWNDLLVIWGQNICTPTSPKCSQCAISNFCKKVGVTKSR